MSSGIYKDIIRQREARQEADPDTALPPDADGYQAFRSGSRAQMGFSVHHANGDIDGFLYHNLDNLSLKRLSGTEFLAFTHRGKAVTMQGRGLKAILQAIMSHTLTEIHELTGKVETVDAPTVQRIKVTTGDEKGNGEGLGHPPV